MRSLFLSLLTFPILLLSNHADALAQAIDGKAHPWQLNFQPAGSEGMQRIEDFHSSLLILITLITIFVLFLLAYICIRFREKANPVPSKTTHNTLLEIIWTSIPVLILVAIAIPSMKLLYKNDKIEEAEMTLKITGYQWYWGYEYPENKISFESYLIKDKDIKPGQVRLLEVDNRIVLPINTNIRIQTTAADVIHSWGIPALAMKIDAVPGRLNETWMRITSPGIYRGQCSELCGILHGFMPIVVQAVSREQFNQWVKSKGGTVALSTEPKKATLASAQKNQ